MCSGRRPHDPYTRHYNLFQCGYEKTVFIVLTMAALHDLEVKAADLLNAYVMAPSHEKIWAVLGPEFGDDAGKSALIVRALHRLI